MPNFTVTYRYRGEDRTLEVRDASDRTAAQADAEKPCRRHHHRREGEAMSEYHDAVYVVTLTIDDECENPGQDEIGDLLYRYLPNIDTRDAVYVERQP